jgi:hypothetical protein
MGMNHFVVKTSGGAGSQLIALMNAIYISSKTNRKFKVRHYPTSTGTYAPFALEPILYRDEVDSLDAPLAGFHLHKIDSALPGSIMMEHPLLRKGFNKHKFLKILRIFGLEPVLNRLRNEWSINQSIDRLTSLPGGIDSISGGFVPFYNQIVENELKARFENSNLQSIIPDVKAINSFDIVIHYRLGDKRLSGEFSRLGIDGVIDPKVFSELTKIISPDLQSKVYVVSDEPEIAKQLLASEGIYAESNPFGSDIWSDLRLMTNANALICSWSTVSQAAAVIGSHHNKLVYFPTKSGTSFTPKWNISGVKLFEPKFLPGNHNWG